MIDIRPTVQSIPDSVRRLVREQRSSRGEEGAVLVETALSLIILLTFLFGVMEGALALYSYHFISEAAREGARYAIVRGSLAGTACGTSYNSFACIASPGNVQSYVKNLGFPGINPGNMTVAPAWSAYVNGDSCPATGPCNSPGNLITITVTYNFPLTVPFIPAQTWALSSTAAMIIQN